MRDLFLLCCALIALYQPALSASDYYEQLLLRPLPLPALLASFNFQSNTSLAAFEAHNFRFFPRSLGQILQHAGTRELHLRFSLGRWDARSWGARPWEGMREGATGVELWAWLEAETEEEADYKWMTLTNALSGLFCASLNFIDATRTTRPVMSFEPKGHHSHSNLTNTRLLYGVLPREVVCTENLTPFLKLLPCKGKAGIASLLDGHKLFDASWQSMAIDVRPVCEDDGDECVLAIEQTIDMVLDIERSKRPRGELEKIFSAPAAAVTCMMVTYLYSVADNPIPRPPPNHELKCDSSKSYHTDDICFPDDHSANQEWSLSQVFGKAMKGSCPLTDSTVPPVCLHVPDSRIMYVSSGVSEVKGPDNLSRCYDVQSNAEVDIVLPRIDEGEQSQVPFEAQGFLVTRMPALYAERSFTGHGQERGGVQTILTNPSSDLEVEFIYMESLPWFMRIYLHTLEVRIDGRPGMQNHLIQKIYYQPALDRTRGTQLELRIRIPASSTVFLTYDFEKSILRYTEYPPDANRGFDVAAAVITVLNDTVDQATGLSLARYTTSSNLRTTSLLLSLPTPDFSMPYNVIIFTSTAIALAFGGMFNILVRRFVAADEGPEAGLKAVGEKIHVRLGKLLTKPNKPSRVSGFNKKD